MFGNDKEEKLKLRILVESIGDSCIIRDVKLDDKVKDVKEKIEAFIGIPRYAHLLITGPCSTRC